ncbi:MAG: peptidoglycan DD-metalloendopeptidase family protein [Bacteroidetes bacterium]|nr:peptidoglycan DD-metalloendopeptidase family protein [Bacteroidota bacterium]
MTVTEWFRNNKVLSFLLFSGLLILLFQSVTIAQTSKDKLQKTKKQLEEEIRFTNSLLDKTQKSKQNSLNRLLILNKQIEKRESLIETMNREVGQMDTEIDGQNRQIQKLTTELSKLKEEYARMIYFAYKNMNAYNRLMFIFSSRDFNQAFHRLKYYQQYSAYRRKQAELIQAMQAELSRQKKSLELNKGDKLLLVTRQGDEKNRLTKEKVEKDRSVKELSQKEKNLLATLKEKQQTADKLQREIEKVIADEIKTSVAKAKTTGISTTGTKNEMMLTPMEKELSSSFTANKGKLPWPLEKGVITGVFGEHPHPVLKYVKVKNNGIDISTEKGAGARCVFKGKVSRVISFPNMNKVVIIRHGEFLTVYSNLESVIVKDGQDVSTKQVIGLVHTNGEDSRTELHFEIWLGKNIQNPQDWLVGNN